MTSVRALAHRDEARWRAATSHPFLDGVRTGELPNDAFDRWLVQDRHFVEALTRAWATIAAGAPGADLQLLADGISAFAGELAWFDGVAAERALAPEPPLPAASAYAAHLHQVAGQPYAVAMAAMWAVEAAYLDAWRSARPGAAEYRAFVEHWANDDFAAFVTRVESVADVALGSASRGVFDAACAAVDATLDHEAAFWAMTWSG